MKVEAPRVKKERLLATLRELVKQLMVAELCESPKYAIEVLERINDDEMILEAAETELARLSYLIEETKKWEA